MEKCLHISCNHYQKKGRVVIFVSDKVGFREKKITRYRDTLYKDKRVSPPRKHNVINYVCAKEQNYKT